MTPAASPPPLPSERSWCSGRWVVPALVVGIGLFLLAGVAVFAGGLMAVMKSSGAYRQALAAARADPRLASALGTPLEDGWYLTGSIRTGNDGGEARLQIPLSGPRGRARLHVDARNRGGDWTFDVLQARLAADGRILDLRPTAARHGASIPSGPTASRKTGANRKGE